MRKLPAALVLILLAVLVVDAASSQSGFCQRGTVRAFATVTGDRISGPGGISSRFDGAERLFARRYNCEAGGAQVRRVDLGVYEIRFPKVRALTAVVSAYNAEGTNASVVHTAEMSTFRVVLSGPQISENILRRRDVPFTIAIF